MSTVCLYDITNEKLGKGHFAVVKLAKHCLTGELVAVKIIDKLRLNNENLQQLGQEIRLLSRLSEKEHPNIVKLYQVIDTKTKLYLVLEYPGREVCDLYDFIEKNNTRNGLTEKVAKHVFKQIVSAVSYCHNCGIVHRDLKPENILVVNQPEEMSLKNRIEYPIVKLIDFGFSNQWNEGQKLRTSCGTLAFSSPEILLNCEYEGDKVDIWGLGCILYILLYGSSPFMQLNDSETLIKILDCSFNTPQRPNVNEHSINLIRSLLRKDPKSRLTIKQILEHPWLKEEILQQSTQQHSPLNEKAEIICEQKDINKENLNKTTEQLDDEMLELKKKLSSVDNDKLLIRNFDDKLHENVIEQMINKGMIDSKEQIENAIKTCSHKIANASKLEIVKKIIPNKDELKNEQISKDLEDEKRDCFNTDNKLINQFHLEEYNSNLLAKEDAEKAYLTATYNLLKDKIYREQQGINLTNQIQSKLMHHKKVLPTRPRRSIIKQPQFGLTSSSASNSRPDSANSCELNEIPSSINQLPEEQTNQKLNDLASKVAGINELPVYEEDNGFILPLQRKCSIVSEEGSCIVSDSGNEYSSDINSAHNSISNYNSLNDYTLNAELNKVRSHSYINSNTNQSSNNSSKRNSRENLKIQSMPIVNIVIQDFSNTIEEDERLEIDEFNNCTFSKADNNEEENELIDDRKIDSNNSNYFYPQLNSLHQASSSPDLNRQDKLDEDKIDQIISKQDEDRTENAFDEHVLNQLNQSTNSKISSLHTSMRIIMQSKSCNSILCSGLNNKEEHCSNCELNKQQNDEKEDGKKLIEQQQNQSNLNVKDDQLSTKSNKSTNLSIFDKMISKFNAQKDDTKRLSLNLEPEDKENLHSENRFTIRKCKKDKISCCAIS